jgi:hypothetical protein
LGDLQDEQKVLASMVKYNANVSPQRIAELKAVNEEIAKKQRAIGEN